MNNKIAIVTLFGMNNYGNRLQNYAMQVILERFGYCAETICEDIKNYKWYSLKINLKYYIRKIVKRYNNDITIRQKRFLRFEDYIRHSKYGLRSIPDRIDFSSYKYVVYGSDQIWNTEFNSFSELYLGYYSNKEKNIAVSASFGTNDIEEEYLDLFKKGLENFKTISVRENRGKEIISKYTDIDCKITIDPTMALTKEEWMKVECKVFVPDNYILTYFLGRFPEIDFEDYQVISCEKDTANGPSEFIYMIHHANVVYTDSFHACVFSLIFGVPFYVFKRKGDFSSMMSRIHTVLEKLDICYVENKDYYYVSKEEVSKTQVKENIDLQKMYLENFLMDAFDI